MSLEASLRHTIAVRFGANEDKITTTARLIADIGLDSLDTVELIMCIEEEFNVEISDDDAESAQTFGDLVAMTERIVKQRYPV